MNEENHFDAIVIGSGIGGLAAAGMLARLQGKRILVLEKHFELGGLTHVFRRGGYEWDVGLHYVGGMEQGCLSRVIMDFLTDGKLKWNKMPSAFEKFVYPDLTISQTDDAESYRKSLAAVFPEDARGLRRYFSDLAKSSRWHVRDFWSRFFPWYVAFWIRLVNLPGRRRALETTGEYLRKRFQNAKLRAVLASQWGDYGLPPKESSFATHALVTSSYSNGAYYPRGGSSKIARYIEEVIGRCGGECRANQEVSQIILEGRRAVGVRVIDRSGAEAQEKQFFAPIIISDTGARNTYFKLLPAQHTAGVRDAVRQLALGCSVVTLYLGLSDSPQTIGIQGENVWICETYDHDDLEGDTRELMSGRPRRAYVSFPSLKSGDRRYHTVEIITSTAFDPFARWEGTEWKHRDAEYYELKDAITSGLLKLVEKHIPGLMRLVTYKELSTPLTIEYFTSRSHGEFNGIPATPKRYKTKVLRVRTPVRNLFLSGSDVSSIGIAGAMWGGVAAASVAVGRLGLFRLVGAAYRWAAIRRPQAEQTGGEAFRRHDDILAKVVAKRSLTDTVLEIIYQLDRNVVFVPGQYVKVQVGEAEWREYSIAEIHSGLLKLIVDVRSGGLGSLYMAALHEGDQSIIRPPMGQFRLVPGDRVKTFVATATGVVPFLSMLKALADAGHREQVQLYFGCRTRKDNFLDPYIDALHGRLALSVVLCLSAENSAGNWFQGRVTDALRRLEDGMVTKEFYVAGNPNMTSDVARMLHHRGVSAVYTESY
jgi:phytoene dehydrogenase-like protein/NAD(P)H-flavin reductase